MLLVMFGIPIDNQMNYSERGGALLESAPFFINAGTPARQLHVADGCQIR